MTNVVIEIVIIILVILVRYVLISRFWKPGGHRSEFISYTYDFDGDKLLTCLYEKYGIAHSYLKVFWTCDI